MAQFCTKCGSPMGEGMKFCVGCGANFGEPAAPSIQAPLAGTPAAPPRPAPMAVSASPGVVAPAAKSGSPVLKIILIVVGVIIFLILLSAASCAYMLYRAKKGINQFEKQVQSTYPRPTGTREIHTQPMTPTEAPTTPPVADIGTLGYPGATPGEGGNQGIVGLGGVKLQQSTTSDSVDTVVAFYKAKLGPTAMVTQSGEQALVQLVGSNGVVNVTIAPDKDSGKTKITISSIGR